tara:strand:+ start:396 stop:1364 length:969 start_codon:yes stop_codon:yes gene_type:complete
VHKPLKILVVRFSSIGDIVLTTPVVRTIKEQIGAEVHYLTLSLYKNIVRNNPYIDKVYLINKNIDEEVINLKNEHYDLLVDLHHNIRTAMLKSKLDIYSKSYRKLNIQKWFLTTFKINILPKIHVVDRYFETIAHLGIINDNKGLDFFLSEEDKVIDNEYAQLIKKDYLAFVIGGRHKTKMLPANKIISICKKINERVVLIGGKEDFEIGEQIVNGTKNSINSCGKFSIGQSAYLIKKAKYVFTNDTGMMHIAAAFKKKIYSVWGNTIPGFGMTPYLANSASKIIEVRDLFCRPCSKIGFDRCPKGHFNCMNRIDENLFLSK